MNHVIRLPTDPGGGVRRQAFITPFIPPAGSSLSPAGRRHAQSGAPARPGGNSWATPWVGRAPRGDRQNHGSPGQFSS